MSTQINDTTKPEDRAVIDIARETGEVIRVWNFVRNTQTLYRLPDGSGIDVHRAWNGWALGQPWEEEWYELLSAQQLAHESAQERFHQTGELPA